jgi:hypothetical protein
MSKMAFEMGRKAGLKEAAAYCEKTEMGVGPKGRGKYIAHPSTCFQTGSGTHAGMGYAENLRGLALRDLRNG